MSSKEQNVFYIGQDQRCENIPEIKFVIELKEPEMHGHDPCFGHEFLSAAVSAVDFSDFDLNNQDTCSWEGKLERPRSSKVRNEIGRNEVGNFEPKLESDC